MKHFDALIIAEKYISMFKPYCKRIEVAGSIRRMKPEVKDIEIVAIPDSYKLEQALKFMVGMKFLKNGEKYKQIYLVEGINLDLFLPNEKTWAMIYLIRTGSADFVHKLMITINNKKYKCTKGILYCYADGLKPLPNINEEKDIFNILGMEWIDPQRRV